jgi:transcriptional regulator of nitric oxide reductase
VSFSFSAVGSKDEVVRQLRHVAPAEGADGFNKAGREIALLIARHLEAYQQEGPWTYSYVVKAQGHSSTSGTPLSLNVTVEPLWIPEPPAEPERGPVDEPEAESALD